MVLSQALNEGALKNPSNAAIFDLGRAISFSEFRKRVGQLSYLYLSEIPAGEKVAFISRNSASFALSVFALSNTGNPYILFDPSDSDENIVKDLKQLEINYLLISTDQSSRVSKMLREAGLGANVIEIEKKRGGEYDSSFSPPPERPLKDSDNVLIMRHDEYGEERMYSYFDHKHLHASYTGIKKFYRLLPTDRILTTMSWAHPFAFTHGLLLPLLSGSTACIDPESPTIEEFVEYLATERITRFIGPPKFYYQLLSYCASKKYALPGVKSITVGTGSLSLALRKTFKLLKIPVLRCYGRTEAIWSIAMDNVEEALDIENAKSKLVAGAKCKVLDDSGDEIPGPDQREGPLAVMVNTLTNSFFHRDEDRAAQYTRNKIRGTWFYTGEIARLEGEGNDTTIAVLGRATDMIKSGNHYLSPRRMDDLAKAVPGVADAAGFVREDKSGHLSFACAVVPEGKMVSESIVLHALAEKLSGDMQPKTVHFVDRIPKDAFDSVNRTALRKQFSGI